MAESFVSPASLTQAVFELRKALGDAARPARYIRTVFRYGYAFCEEVGSEDVRVSQASHFFLRHPQRLFPLAAGDNVIGRDPGARVCLDSGLASRRHARVVVSEAGVHVEDLGSKNGTFVEGRALDGRRELRPGERITIGKETLTLEVEAATGTTRTDTSSVVRARARVGRRSDRDQLSELEKDMQHDESVRTLTDRELLSRLTELLRQSRRVEAELIAHMAEVDARRLYLREAASSMFAYATQVMHLSEAEAYLRITVARASKKHPVLLAMLADGRLHLSGAGAMAPHLTVENREAVLARAAHKSKRQIEELVAELAPRPEVPVSIRKLPEPPRPVAALDAAAPELRRPGLQTCQESTQLFPERVGDWVIAGSRTTLAPAAPRPQAPLVTGTSPAQVAPIAPSRYRVQFTASQTLRDKLERLQALLPGADLPTVIEQAVTEKLERLDARRFAKTKAPRKSLGHADTGPGPRYIPAPVKRAVYDRDGGRCGFVDATGRRCGEKRWLEFHHRRPHGNGGDRSLDNISLRCRAHNAYLAEVDYGRGLPSDG